MNYYTMMIFVFLIGKSFGYDSNKELEDKIFNDLEWAQKNSLCKEHENKIGYNIIFYPTAMDDLSPTEYRSRNRPWSELSDPIKKAWCHITENENERAFFWLPPKYKIKFCNVFKKKHNIKIYNDISFTVGTHHLPWNRLSHKKKIEHCKSVAKVKDPNNPYIKKIKRQFEEDRKAILTRAQKRFAERHKIFQKKVDAIKSEFHSRVGSIKRKGEEFDKRFNEKKDSFVSSSTKHLKSFSELKEKDKMRQVYDSFIYTFSNGLVGNKKDCTVNPICSEKISIKDKFINFFKILFDGDQDKKKIVKNDISQKAKKQIEIISNL